MEDLCPEKLEPIKLNNEARLSLLTQMTQRKQLIRSCLIWEVKYAVDQLEFAEAHSLTEPMEKVAKLINDAKERIQCASQSFISDLEHLEALANVAKEIEASER